MMGNGIGGMARRQRFRVRRIGAAAAILAMALTAACGGGTGSEGETTGDGGASPSGQPVVRIDTTMGRFELELDAERAPITTANFLRYAADGYYNGTIVHRVSRGSTIAAGAYSTKLERRTQGLRAPIPSEWGNGLKNERGAVGMVREPGNPNSATSEFYINLAANPNLDEAVDGAGYAVFGHVTPQGMELIDRIGSTQLTTPPGDPAGPMTVPIVPVMIKSVELKGEFDLAGLEARAAALQGEAQKAQEDFLMTQETEAGEIIRKTEAEFGVKFQTTATGLRYATLRPGEGPTPPSSASSVTVHYLGTLTNGKKFDSSYDRNAPATFPLNRVIAGWTEGVGSMKVGEKRRLIIPSSLGYGDRGAPPDIPGKATLVFDVELLAIP